MSLTMSAFILQAQETGFGCGDTIVDSRDGQIYLTVLIGNQCWMAENLNYGQPVTDNRQTDNSIPEKTCYNNDPKNCKVYGGLYTWNEAMQYTTEEGTRGMCPSGWHLPSNAEWTKLNAYLGIDSTGQKMKVTPDAPVPWDGNNKSGFSALPGGVGYKGDFGRQGKWAVFWSSSENTEKWAWSAQLDNFWYPVPPKYPTLYQANYFVKDNAFSVRCIKDKE